MHSLRRYYPDQVQGYEDVSASLVSARTLGLPYHATIQLSDAVYSITIVSNVQQLSSPLKRFEHKPKLTQAFYCKIALISHTSGIRK